MIKRILFFFFLLSLIFTFVSPRGIYAQEEGSATAPAEIKTEEEPEPEYDFASMTTYEMFWPLVAGKVPGDRFYQLKVWRDKLIGYLFFSDLKKAEYLKKLANKRLVEADRLLELGRESFLAAAIKEAEDYLEQGAAALGRSPVGEAQLWLRGEFAKDAQKHLIVLERMKEKAGEKGVIEESIGKIKKLLEERQLAI